MPFLQHIIRTIKRKASSPWESHSNKGEKVPTELGYLLESNSRILGADIDLDKVDYDGTYSLSVPAEQVLLQRSRAHEAGANVMITTKLRIGDANTMMAEGGIQAADKENDSRHSIILMHSAADILLQDRNCFASS